LQLQQPHPLLLLLLHRPQQQLLQEWQQVQGSLPQQLGCLQQLACGLAAPDLAEGWLHACCALLPAAHRPAECLLLLLLPPLTAAAAACPLLAACLLLKAQVLLLLLLGALLQHPLCLLVLLLLLQVVVWAHALLHLCLQNRASPHAAPGG
jgi:hypothetical protein